MSPNAKSRLRSSSSSLLKSNSAGVTLKRGELKISDPIPIPREGGDGFGPLVLPQQDDSGPKRADAPAVQDNSATQQGLDPRISSFNTTPSLSTGPSKTSLSKPRASLKGTLKRLFGGGKRRNTIASIAEEPSRREALSFITAANTTNQNAHSRRMSPLRVQEATRYSALGSHAPASPGFGSPGYGHFRTLSQPKDSFDLGYHHKRRNTLSGGNPVGPGSVSDSRQKRRSRSATQLREMTQPARNRDDEISYWRRSIAEEPAPAYAPSRPTTRCKEDTVYESSREQALTDNEGRSLHVMPSQTFDFGNLMGHNPEDSVEQRLTTLEVKIVDLEVALARLSGNDVGRAVVLDKPPATRPTGRNSRQSSFLSESSYKSDISPQPTSHFSSLTPQSSGILNGKESPAPDQNNRGSAATTLRPGTAFRRSVEPRAPSPAQSAITSSSSYSRVQSSAQQPYATIDHIEKLMILIQREQANRHKLELQYKTLESQVEMLQQRSPPYAHFKVNQYPTPSPDEQNGSSSRVRRISSAAAAVGAGGGGGSTTSLNQQYRQKQQQQQQQQQQRTRSNTRYRDDISVDTDTTATTTDDDGFLDLDVYETPIENPSDSQSIAFGQPQPQPQPQPQQQQQQQQQQHMEGMI